MKNQTLHMPRCLKSLEITSIKQSTQRSMLNIFQMHTECKGEKNQIPTFAFCLDMATD